MNEHYPHIRIWAENGTLLLREGLRLCFYIHHHHEHIRHQVLSALETYQRAVGTQALSIYPADDDWAPLDDSGWEYIRNKLMNPQLALIRLFDDGLNRNQYCFNYCGRPVGDPSLHNWPGTVCALDFWLPTEFLEQRGPEYVRSLALELAGLLPFCSGHVSLAFNGELDIIGVPEEIRRYCFRYPGLDIVHLERLANHLGTRVRGGHWMTFLGQPVLGSLGGAAALRSRLTTPGTHVQELDAERAVVTLGEWPEAGDTEAGLLLPAYRELARVLEPWTYFEEHLNRLESERAERHRWERRFLD